MTVVVVLALAFTLAAPSATVGEVSAEPKAEASGEPKAEASYIQGVPLVRQARERCGPAALVMVMRYYQGDSTTDSTAEAQAEASYDPVLKGALITDLAAAARRAGFEAAVETPGQDSLLALLRHRVPPILLIDGGVGPLAKGHYVVLIGCDSVRGRVTIHDGGARPRTMARVALIRRWRSAGGQALVVRPR